MTPEHPTDPARLCRRKVLRVAAAAALNVLPSLPQALAQPRKPGEVVLGGTGAGIAPLRKVLEGAGTSAHFVPNLGSGGGLKALAAGAVDMALSARRLNDAERAQGMVEHELFRTPFVWAVHADTPLQGVSLAELADLYLGKRTTWPDGRVVRLILRPDTDSDTQLVKSISAALAIAITSAGQRLGVRVAITDDDAAADIERITGAIGTTTLALVMSQQRQVALPPLAGVTASVDSLVSGRYPYFKTIYLATRGAVTPEVSATLALLHSKSGATTLARAGCLAVART